MRRNNPTSYLGVKLGLYKEPDWIRKTVKSLVTLALVSLSPVTMYS